MLASERIPPQLAALKRQHAEHLLEVVRLAEKREAERQKRLRHATSKFSVAYLQKRFDTERRQNQTQISRLIQDAHAVEAALRSSANAAGRLPEEEEEGRDQKGPGNNQRDSSLTLRPKRATTAAAAAAAAAAVSGEGGGVSAAVTAGGACGGGLSVRGGRGGGGATSECNAFIELPEPGGGDSRFISAKQMRFMDYVHKREDCQRLPRRAPVGPTTTKKPTGADHTTTKGEHRTRQKHRQRGGGGGGGGGSNNQTGGGPAGLRVAAASVLLADKSLPLPRRGQGTGAAAAVKPTGGRGTSPLSHGTGRRRLLAEKRGILLELKGVVNRQAEALDRLVDSCGDTLGNGGVRSRGGVGSGSGGSRGGSRGSKFSGWDNGSSIGSRSSAPERGGTTCKYSQESRGGDNASWPERFAAEQGAPGYDNVRAKQRAAVCSPAMIASARGKANALFPPRPPENGTSDFLARGGRWGRGGGTRGSGRNSVASSASYATYANKGRARREDAFGACRRPAEVPVLLL